MIEISHQQAQRLIREQQDRPLPDEQWAMLQAHLESCPSCHAYQQRLATYDRDLHRLLRSRWSSVRGPGEGIAAWIMRLKANRKKMRRFAGRAALGILGLLLLVGYITYRDLTAPPPPPPMPTPTSFIAGVATPTPEAKTLFRGLVAFGSRRDGNGEIYLMTFSPNGVELNNLTQNPAEDSSPSWSPDGEWLAFLSDRSGKTEVYVETVAGSRLTQLSNDPNVDWEGPLTWSSDGKWIGLRGRRGGPVGSTWLYLVPLDGSEPHSLGLTMNSPGTIRFSSTLPMAAFSSKHIPGSLLALNTETGWYGEMSYEDNNKLRLRDAPADAFDWSLGGHSLVYVANGPYDEANPSQLAQGAHSEIRLSQEIQTQTGQTMLGSGSKVLDSLPVPGAFRAVSWVPNTLLVSALHKEGVDTCWTLWLRNVNNADQPPRDLRGLCIDGGLARSNWSTDGKWAVVIAHQPGEKGLSIYALRAPADLNRVDTTQPEDKVYFEPLASLDTEPVDTTGGQEVNPAGTPGATPGQVAAPSWAEPQVRPTGRSLKLSPRAAKQPNPIPVSVFPGKSEPGWIVYTVGRGPGQQIYRIRPDGSGRQALTGNPYSNICPRISPDGKSIAFLSDRASNLRGAFQVFRMDIDGNNTIQLTRSGVSETSPAGMPEAGRTPGYDCPVWSPDGNRLAVIWRDSTDRNLVIITADSKTPLKRLKIEDTSSLSSPVWVPRDPKNPALGADEVLLVYPVGSQPAGIVSVDLEKSKDQEAAVTQVRSRLIGWSDVQDLALSPDGQQLAGILVYFNSAVQVSSTVTQLRVFDTQTFNVVAAAPLTNYRYALNFTGGLSWQQDGQVSLAEAASLLGPEKTVFQIFDPNQRSEQAQLQTLASFEDLAYRAAWARDGWVIFSAESGLWALDTRLASSGSATPAQLSEEQIFDLDWR